MDLKYIKSSYFYKLKAPRKDEVFYQEMNQLSYLNFDCYKELLELITKMDYYKDYMYLLLYCDNPKAKDYIYDDIVFKMSKWKYGNYMYLSKWLPREKSSFDRKLNFIDDFTKKLFPDIKLNERRRLYRIFVSETCKKLNTFETNLCNKTYDLIEDVTEKNLKTYSKVIMRNTKLKKRISFILNRRYEKMGLKRLLIESQKFHLKELRNELLKPYIKNKSQTIMYPPNVLLIINLTPRLYNLYMNDIKCILIRYMNNHNEFIIGEKKLTDINTELSSYIEDYNDDEYDYNLLHDKYPEYDKYVVFTLNTSCKNTENISYINPKLNIKKYTKLEHLNNITDEYKDIGFIDSIISWINIIDWF